MEDKTKNIRKRTFSNREERFQPIVAIGRLLFFDYTKNKFGFISEVKCAANVQAKKVHVSESGLSTDKRLNDRELVTLILNKGQKGFYATNVKSFSEINLKTISHFTDLIGINELKKAIYNSVKYEYQNLDSEDKALIGKILQKENNSDAWELLLKIGADGQLIDNYISVFITPLKDEEKVNFLKKSFNASLLDNILTNWTTQDKIAILNLTEAIRNKELAKEQIPNSFINIVTNLEWTFEEIYKIYSIFKVSEISSQALKLFSFKIYNYKDKLKSLIPINLIDENIIKKLKSNLNSDKERISANELLDIFTELKDYQIIKDENELLELLSDKTLNDSAITNLISQLSDSCQIKSFKKIISNSIENISPWQIIKLIESCEQKNELAKVLIDEYYSHENEDSSPDYSELINFLKEPNQLVLRLHFIEKFYKQLSIKYPIEILELAIISKHTIAQKFAYQNIIFKTEDEIVNFIEKASKYNITDEVKTSNKPLTAFLLFLDSTSNFKLTEECKRFLQINKGIVQCLSVKFLIFQLHKQKISKTQLIDILNSFQWTEISALLIKAFIQESNYTEKILLDKLNEIFKTHFEILSSQNFEQKSFLDNFTIRNILNSCYCEGRPWKKESLWDSQTNKPSTEQYEFYWCKTSYCASRNDTVNLDLPFNHWTLSEISAALNIKIEKIALATLAGWANRMNQIIKHLFCRSCKEVLRPLPFRPNTLGYYAVPLFHCINDECTDKQTIRFTHCLNGKCESHKTSEPLDSRDCKSCRPSDMNHTGLQCNYCGSSCPACSGLNNRILAREVW
jgi:cold shock CspA family protein